MTRNSKTFFKRNIDQLAEFQPELAQKLSKIQIISNLTQVIASSGDPILKKKGMSFHSRRDPWAEARKFAQSDAIQTIKANGRFPVIFGLGSGYHIRALSEEFDTLAVIETDMEVLRLSLETFDWTSYLSRITFLTRPDQIPARIKAQGTLLAHRPSQRSSPADYARFLAIFDGHNLIETHASQNNTLKFMVVSPIWGGSLPITFHAVKALTSLGHEVRCLDLSVIEPLYMDIQNTDPTRAGHDLAAGRLVQFMGDYVALMAESEKPDFLLALAQAPLNKPALARIRSLGIRTAFWFVEDYRFMKYFREIADSYDFFFHIQGQALEKELTDLSVEHFSYLPLAADPELFKPAENLEALAPFRTDLSFMGSGYPNRRHLFSKLLDHDLKIWGTEWNLNSSLGQRVQDQNRRIPTEETVLIYNAAKINLNLHSSVFEAGLDREGAFINPRTFEIAACAAFQLVDERNPLCLHFELGNELAVFTSLDDLREKISFYLREPDLRKDMGFRARERVLAEHTYQHRMTSMIEFMLARV